MRGKANCRSLKWKFLFLLTSLVIPFQDYQLQFGLCPSRPFCVHMCGVYIMWINLSFIFQKLEIFIYSDINFFPLSAFISWYNSAFSSCNCCIIFQKMKVKSDDYELFPVFPIINNLLWSMPFSLYIYWSVFGRINNRKWNWWVPGYAAHFENCWHTALKGYFILSLRMPFPRVPACLS